MRRRHSPNSPIPIKLGVFHSLRVRKFEVSLIHFHGEQHPLIHWLCILGDERKPTQNTVSIPSDKCNNASFSSSPCVSGHVRFLVW